MIAFSLYRLPRFRGLFEMIKVRRNPLLRECLAEFGSEILGTNWWRSTVYFPVRDDEDLQDDDETSPPPAYQRAYEWCVNADLSPYTDFQGRSVSRADHYGCEIYLDELNSPSRLIIENVSRWIESDGWGKTGQ